MTCEKYRKTLFEVAATGGELERGLADHLEVCSQCYARLQRERRLFADIDDALRTKVNEMPRAGFSAALRAHVAKEVLPKSQWSPMWALAGAVLTLALIAIAHPWTRLPRQTVEDGTLKAQMIPAQLTLEIARSGRESAEDLDVRERAQRHLAKRPTPREPEVLVPPDEGRALAQFVARLRRRDEVAKAFVSPATDRNDDPSQIPAVEIARLRLEPLVWEKWK